MVKIRLRRMGAKKQPTYRFVVCDAQAPRDGRSSKSSATTTRAPNRKRSSSTRRRSRRGWPRARSLRTPCAGCSPNWAWSSADRFRRASARRTPRSDAESVCAFDDEFGLFGDEAATRKSGNRRSARARSRRPTPRTTKSSPKTSRYAGARGAPRARSSAAERRVRTATATTAAAGRRFPAKSRNRGPSNC